MQHGVHCPVLFQLFDGQALEQILLSQEVGLQRGKQQTLAKTARTAQKIIFTSSCQFIYLSRLIYVDITALAGFLKKLCMPIGNNISVNNLKTPFSQRYKKVDNLFCKGVNLTNITKSLYTGNDLISTKPRG